jgi:predicted SAM-dependent methyltransferase
LYADILSINLCCGDQKIEGYVGVDFLKGTADIVVDLRYEKLPLADNSADKLICISAINYFKYQRAKEIIKDVYRVMKPNGIVRFGVQDLRLIAMKYINNDKDIFFPKIT